MGLLRLEFKSKGEIMERTEIAQWLRVTGKRLIPMRGFLDNVALHLDEGFELDSDTKIEISKKLQTIAEYVWLERDEATAEGKNLPDINETLALISAMNELNPKLNIVQADFTKQLTPVA